MPRAVSRPAGSVLQEMSAQTNSPLRFIANGGLPNCSASMAKQYRIKCDRAGNVVAL